MYFLLKWGYSIQLQLCDRLPRRVLHFFWLGRKTGDFFPSNDLEGLGHTYHKHLIEGWRVWFQEPERRSRLFRCNNARIRTTGFYLVKLGGFKDTRHHRRIQPGQIIATSHDRWDPPKGSKLEGEIQVGEKLKFGQIQPCSTMPLPSGGVKFWTFCDTTLLFTKTSCCLVKCAFYI